MYWQIKGFPPEPHHKRTVSVLIPTRGRPEKLRRALLSLSGNVQRREKVEILLRVDEDDVETQAFLESFLLSFSLQTTVLTGPRGNGYLDIHHHLHDMAAKAGGHWLFVFNDDAVMLTPNWDQWFDITFVEHHGTINNGESGQVWVDDLWLLIPEIINNPQSNEFFAVTRKTFEVLGHLGLNMGVDLWLDTIFTLLQRVVRISEVKVSHLDEHDKTFIEGRGIVKGKLLFELTASRSVLRGRLQDSVTLFDYLEDFGKKPEGMMTYVKQPHGLFISYKDRRGLVQINHNTL